MLVVSKETDLGGGIEQKQYTVRGMMGVKLKFKQQTMAVFRLHVLRRKLQVCSVTLNSLYQLFRSSLELSELKTS